MIQLMINGERREVPGGLNLRTLLDHLQINAGLVAIERNLEILPRGDWPSTPVQPGDEIEIVHFVGGGSHLA